MIEIILKNPLFSGLNSREISGILDITPHRITTYSPSDVIALQDDICDRLMLITAGKAQGQMVNDSGKVVVIEDLTPPALLAPAFLYAAKNRYPVNVLSVERCEVLSIHKQDFTILMQNETRILQNFLMLISERSRFLSEKIMFLAFKNIKGKIAYHLLHSPSVNNVVELQESQQELADRFGVARPSLARAFGELEEEGIIEIKRRHIRILNPEALKKLAQ